MAAFEDYSSLLSAGFGLGIGLSIFRAPIAVRARALRAVLETELLALARAGNDVAKAKRRDLADLSLRLWDAEQQLRSLLIPCLWLTVAGAAINLILLILVSGNAKRPLTGAEEAALIFFSVGFYIIIGVILEIGARWKIVPLVRAADEIRRRQK